MTEWQPPVGSTASRSAVAADDPRLQPPPPRADAIARPRLLERVLRSRDERIVAIVAPAGYGKTTLLAQWRAAEERSVAWVTVDAGCADPAVVLALVATAIDGAAGSDVGSALVGEAAGAGFLASAVPRLATAIHRLDRPLVLMLDDLHAIEGTDALDAIATLVGYLPASTVVGFACRTTAGLPMARWRASGLTLELDERDLALEPDESLELVRQIDHGMDTGRALALHARTEGWPAALYLAARAAGEAEDLETPGFAIDGYLRDELVDRIDPEARRLLLECSVLDRLSGPLCAAVTGEKRSGERLARLAGDHHLITALDPAGRWYRIHPLFRGYLLQRLEQDGADVATLHRRAARWLAANGHADQAVEHLLAAGETGEAASIAAILALPIVRDGRLATLDRWMAQFTTLDLETNPRLTAAAAVSAILRGEAQRASTLSALLDKVRAGSSGVADVPADIVAALTARHGLDEAFARAVDAAEREDVDSPWRPVALAIAAGLAVVRDDRSASERLLPEAIAEGHRQRAYRALAGAVAFQSIAAGRQDAWIRADGLARDAVALTDRTGQANETTGGLAYAAAARSAGHRGDVPGARRHLASLHGASVALTAAAPWLSVAALIEGARAYLAISDPSGARTLLRHAESIVATRPELGLLDEMIQALQARMRTMPPGVSGASTLTQAEIRVLLLLPTYLSMPEIAERLVVSPNTVRTQVQSIYGKLGASSRSEAIELAIEAGLLEPLPILAAT